MFKYYRINIDKLIFRLIMIVLGITSLIGYFYVSTQEFASLI